jgi:mannosylglycoprotein endo-beta-mannosidase
LFAKPKYIRIEIGHSGFNTILEASSVWLEKPHSIEEVKQVAWDSDGSKAPGPDGYAFSLYKKVLDLISSDVFMMVQEFFRTGRFPKGISSSFVTLIIKTKEPNRFFQFCPISSIHELYKIVAKLLSTRLRSVLSDVISVNQLTFIVRRQILDGFMIANKVVYGIVTRRSTISY